MLEPFKRVNIPNRYPLYKVYYGVFPFPRLFSGEQGGKVDFGEITPPKKGGEIFSPVKAIDFRPLKMGGLYNSIYNDRFGAHLVGFTSFGSEKSVWEKLFSLKLWKTLVNLMKFFCFF